MNEDPPCEECLPELWEQNRDAIRIWNWVQDQRIYVGMEGVSVALNHESIWRLIDEIQPEDRLGTFEKVLKIFGEIRTIEIDEEKSRGK